jgi:transcriptional regulator with XRE-family HTH domain
MAIEDFSLWLQGELDKRGWTKADLAKHSGLSPSQISRAMTGERGLGEKSVSLVAVALRLPAEEVYRAAGFLPPVNEKRAREDEIEHLISLLGDDDLDDVIEYAKMRLKRQEEKQANIKKSSRSIRPARTALKHNRT